MNDKTKDVLRETDDEAIRQARTLIRRARYGAIATLDPKDGSPIATRTATATDIDGAPLILVSRLSAHTGALDADPRCSLLLGEPGKGDPLAHPRITLACRAQRLERGSEAQLRAARRYLARHPKAALYADFPDFGYFRLDPVSASLNGGFGKAYALTRAQLLSEPAVSAALAQSEAGAVEHMNDDHADAISIYARAYAGAPDGKWRLTGIDPDGIDIADGDDVRRVLFPAPLADASQMRVALVELVRNGRQKLQAVA